MVRICERMIHPALVNLLADDAKNSDAVGESLHTINLNAGESGRRTWTDASCRCQRRGLVVGNPIGINKEF